MTKERAKAGTPSQKPGRVDPAGTTGDSAVVSSFIEPYRRELHVHCYRLLGSVQEAEDLRAFLAATAFGSEAPSRWHLSATGANAQPAFVVYRADDPLRSYRAFGLQVLTIEAMASTRHIADVTTFAVPSLATSFGFPLELPRLC